MCGAGIQATTRSKFEFLANQFERGLERRAFGFENKTGLGLVPIITPQEVKIVFTPVPVDDRHHIGWITGKFQLFQRLSNRIRAEENSALSFHNVVEHVILSGVAK